MTLKAEAKQGLDGRAKPGHDGRRPAYFANCFSQRLAWVRTFFGAVPP